MGWQGLVWLDEVTQEKGDEIVAEAQRCYGAAFQEVYKNFVVELAAFAASAIQDDQARSPVDAGDMPSEVTTLVINSAPIGADVFIDELFVGETPTRTTIDPSVSHTIQITESGYEELIKLIDPATLKPGSSVNLLYRLREEAKD